MSNQDQMESKDIDDIRAFDEENRLLSASWADWDDYGEDSLSGDSETEEGEGYFQKEPSPLIVTLQAAARKAEPTIERFHERPYQGYSLALVDLPQEDPIRTGRVAEAAKRERLDVCRRRILNGSFFLTLEIEYTPADKLGNEGDLLELFGDHAAAFAALLPRATWRSHDVCFREDNHLVLRVRNSKWNRLRSLCFDKLGTDLAYIVGPILRGLHRSEPDSVKVMNNLKKFGVRLSTPKSQQNWKEGSSSTLDYERQHLYVVEICQILYNLVDLRLKYPERADQALFLEREYLARFMSERRLHSPDGKKLINQIFKESGGSSYGMTKEEYLRRSVSATLFRDIETITSTTKAENVSVEERREEGLAGPKKANERSQRPLSEGAKLILEELETDIPKLLRRAVSCAITKGPIHNFQGEEGYKRLLEFERQVGKTLPKPEVQVQNALGATVYSTREEGGNNAVVGSIMDAGKRRGELRCILLESLEKIRTTFEGKSYEEWERIATEQADLAIRYAIKIGAEAGTGTPEGPDTAEQDVYTELMIQSPDGKFRYVTMAERAWVLTSAAKFLRKMTIDFSALRGKGKVDLGAVWTEAVKQIQIDDYSVQLMIEADLSDATFLARREIIIQYVGCLKNLFEDLDPLVLAGWLRQCNVSTMIRRKAGDVKPPLRAAEKVTSREYGPYPEDLGIAEEILSDNLERAYEILSSFLKHDRGGRGKRYISTLEIAKDSLQSAQSSLSVLKATAGSGKTVSTALLLLLAISLDSTLVARGEEFARLIVSTRDSVNTLLKSLGLEPEFKDAFDDLETDDRPMRSVEGGLLDRLQAYLLRFFPGIVLGRIGGQHRLIRSTGERMGHLILSTAPSWINRARQGTSAKIVVVDEVEGNLESLTQCLGMKLVTMAISATPPEGLIPRNGLFTVPSSGDFKSEVLNTFEDVLNEWHTWKMADISKQKEPQKGTRIVVICDSKQDVQRLYGQADLSIFKRKPDSRIASPLGTLNGTPVKLQFTWGGKKDNARILLSPAESGTVMILFTTTQVVRSNGEFDLVVYSDAVRRVLLSPAGQSQVVYMAIDADNVHQIKARAGRQREPQVFSSASKPVTSIMIRSKRRVIPFVHYESTSPFDIGVNTLRARLSAKKSPYRLNEWQARMASFGLRLGKRKWKDGQGSFSADILRLLMEGINQISSAVDRGEVEVDEEKTAKDSLAAAKEWLTGEDRTNFLSVACRIAAAARGEDWEELRELLQAELDKFGFAITEKTTAKEMSDFLELTGHECRISPEILEELACYYPDKICIRQGSRCFNVLKDEDYACSKPPSDGWYIGITGFRKFEWFALEDGISHVIEELYFSDEGGEDILFENEVEFVPRIGSRETSFADSREGILWNISSIPLINDEARDIIDFILDGDMREGNWQNSPHYVEVLKLLDGWVLTTESSSGLLELMMLLSQMIVNLCLEKGSLMFKLRSLCTEPHWVDGVDVSVIDLVLQCVQEIVGGELHTTKTNYGVLRAMKDKSVGTRLNPVTGVYTMMREGDDGLGIMSLNYPEEVIPIREEIVGALSTGSFAKRLIAFEILPEEKKGGRWRIESIERYIPRAVRVGSGFFETVPYSPTVSGSKPYFPIVLRNNMRPEFIRAFRQEIHEYLLTEKSLDLSELWVLADLVAAPDEIKRMESMEADLAGLMAVSVRKRDPSAVKRDEAIDMLTDLFDTVETNPSVAARWRVHASSKMLFSYTMPQKKAPQASPDYLTSINLLNQRLVGRGTRRLGVDRVPADFIRTLRGTKQDTRPFGPSLRGTEILKARYCTTKEEQQELVQGVWEVLDLPEERIQSAFRPFFPFAKPDPVAIHLSEEDEFEMIERELLAE